MFPSRRAILGGDVFRDEYSLSFDGTNDYVNCGEGLGVSLGANYAGDLSVSIWFKANATDNVGLFQIGTHNFGEFSISIDDNLLRLSLNNRGWEMEVAFADTDNWNHVVGVLDVGSESTTLLYLNGVSVGALAGDDDTFPDAAGTDMNDGDTEIGRTHSYEFNGNISDVAAYDTALSASQVKALYNGREPYNHKEGIASGNLIGWWRMGDGILDDKRTHGLVADQVNPTLGAELAVDGGFEAGLTPVDNADDKWTDDGVRVAMNLAMAPATDNAHTGDNSAKITIKDGTSGSIAYKRTDYDATKTYKAEIYMKAGSGQTITAFECFADTSFTGTCFKGSQITPTTDYQYATIYFQPTASTFFVSFKATGTEDHFGYVDSFSIKEVSGNPGIMVNFDGSDFTGDTP